MCFCTFVPVSIRWREFCWETCGYSTYTNTTGDDGPLFGYEETCVTEGYQCLDPDIIAQSNVQDCCNLFWQLISQNASIHFFVFKLMWFFSSEKCAKTRRTRIYYSNTCHCSVQRKRVVLMDISARAPTLSVHITCCIVSFLWYGFTGHHFYGWSSTECWC